jgi:hypothetical protein
MAGKGNTKIFIASSWQLRRDRAAFRELIMEQNNAWHEQGAFLQVIGWEHFIDAVSQTRLQDEYNKAIRECDVFVMLYHTKVGKFTREEFEVALEAFRATGKPLIYTYRKTTFPKKPPGDDDARSVEELEARLQGLEHFKTEYPNRKGLQLHFLQQLYRLKELGRIQFAPPGGARAPGAPVPEMTHVPLSVHVNAQRDAITATGTNATAVGPGGMYLGDNARGNFNTGTQTIIEHQTHIDTGGGAHVGGDVNVSGGDFIGRDRKGG